MPDITMYENLECPLSLVCERFMETPSQMQSYSFFEPYLNDNNKIDCDYYIKIYKSE